MGRSLMNVAFLAFSDRPETEERILFYSRQQSHYNLTNYSSHSIIYQNQAYPTSEHLFQAFKVSYWLTKLSSFRP